MNYSFIQVQFRECVVHSFPYISRQLAEIIELYMPLAAGEWAAIGGDVRVNHHDDISMYGLTLTNDIHFTSLVQMGRMEKTPVLFR
jgi:hypothetical protein